MKTLAASCAGWQTWSLVAIVWRDGLQSIRCHGSNNASSRVAAASRARPRPPASPLIASSCVQMKRLTPKQMAMLLKTAAVGQKAYAGVLAAWRYLLARPVMLASLVVLIVAVLLRLCGWL